MHAGPPTALSGALTRLRAAGGTLPLHELAERLLALRGRIDDRLARRLLAAAFACPADALSDPVRAHDLARLAHGVVGCVPLRQAEFVVVDLETTGLAVRRAAILEIGAVRVAGLRVLDRFETLVDPGRPIPRGITALTGIEAATVARAPTLGEAVGRFLAWLERAPQAPFVAHNAGFDTGFLARALEALRLPPLGRPVLCTRKLARRLLPQLGRYGLDSLSAHLGISNPARHRALGDAEATARALVELLHLGIERARLRTVFDVLELVSAPPVRGRERPDPGARPGGR